MRGLSVPLKVDSFNKLQVLFSKITNLPLDVSTVSIAFCENTEEIELKQSKQIMYLNFKPFFLIYSKIRFSIKLA